MIFPAKAPFRVGVHCWVEISEVTTPIGEWVSASDGGTEYLQSGAQNGNVFPIQQGFWLGVQMFTVFNNTWDDYGEYIYKIHTHTYIYTRHFLGMFQQIHHQQLESEE